MPNPVKMQARVSALKDHGDGVYSVILSGERPFPRFKPGQFLHLTVDPYDPAGGFWPESRVFSIASRPGSETLTIVYSVKGSYTARMRDSLHEGLRVWLKLPYGHFIIDELAREQQDIVLVAGGTGITPFISFLEAKMTSGNTGRIALLYGVRAPHLLLFRDLLSECLKRLGGFSLDLFTEQGDPPTIPGNVVCLHQGRLDTEVIRRRSEALHDPAYFLSGPPQMIEIIRAGLAQSGTPPEKVHIDEWE
jgi:ferredoxin-NADP reductase